MNRRVALGTVILGVIILLIVIAISDGSELNANETEAAEYAQQVSEKLLNAYNETGNVIFGGDGSNFNPKESVLNTSKLLTEIVSEAKKFDYLNFDDSNLKHAFAEIVQLAEESIIGGEQYWRILNSLIELDTLVREKSIAKYENRTIQLAYVPDIENIIQNGFNPDEVKYYWATWKNHIGVWAKENFSISIEGFKSAAILSDMSPEEFWLQNRSITQMEDIMEDMKPIYLQMHGFIRNRIRQKYGVGIIKPDALIPDHLFQHVFTSVLTDVSVLEDIYPHKKLPPYDAVIKENFYSKKLYRIADEFYENLGFTPFPKDYWGDRIKISKAGRRNQDDCQADAFYYTPEIYLTYCNEIKFKKFLDAYSDMGKLYYAKEMAKLPAYFFKTHDLEYSIGKAIMLSASTLSNLKAIGLIVDFDITDDVDMNQLIRRSVHSLLGISINFVHTKVMVDLLSGEVEMNELNNHYWDLMENYLGVEPSEDRDPDSLDFPYTFYSDINKNTQARQFESEILSYQIYEKLCEISRQNSTEPLHKCDFSGSKDVGDALKKVMSLGTSKPLNEVMTSLFPEGLSIKAESLLNFYSPVNEVLIKKNRAERAKIGWKKPMKG